MFSSDKDSIIVIGNDGQYAHVIQDRSPVYMYTG